MENLSQRHGAYSLKRVIPLEETRQPEPSLLHRSHESRTETNALFVVENNLSKKLATRGGGE